MSVTEIDWYGKPIVAHEIGRFLVFVCCGLGKHLVLHKPSNSIIRCGFTAEQAVRVADTLSIYAKQDPDGTTYEIVKQQIGPTLIAWARDYRIYNVDYPTIYKAGFGMLPKPAKVSAAELANVKTFREGGLR